MKSALFLAGLAALFITLAPCASHAQEAIVQPAPDEIGALYLGDSQSLAVHKPRLLTMNANIQQFICSPTGDRIAYLSHTQDDQSVYTTVGVVTTGKGNNTVYLRATDSNDPKATDNTTVDDLCGWSDDAAYLAFSTVTTSGGGDEPSAFTEQIRCIDLVHGSVDIVPMDQLTVPNDSQGQPDTLKSLVTVLATWAPGERLLAFSGNADYSAGGNVSFLGIYDPDRHATQLVVQQPTFVALEGWVNGHTLLYRSGKDNFVYDLAAGKSTPAPATLPSLARLANGWKGGRPSRITTLPALGSELTSPSTPSKGTLSAWDSLISPTATDKTAGKLPTTSADYVCLGRFGSLPKPSLLQLDVLPQYDEASRIQFTPNGGFDRAGTYHAVYLCEGDLKIADLTSRQATPFEKVAAGEKLTCKEEQAVAANYAHQLALGIIMYEAEWNGKYPETASFHDEVYPYVKSDDVFTTPNGAVFQYTPPINSSGQIATDKDIDSPTDTPMGEFDLPCAKIVVYVDGHVQTYPKTPPDQAPDQPPSQSPSQ